MSAVKQLGAIILLSAAILSVAVSAEPQSPTVIEIKHRDASQLIKLLTPLFGKSARLAQDQNRLIVYASAKILTQARDMIKILDQPVARLIVTLSQSAPPPAQGSGATYQTRRRGVRANSLQMAILNGDRFQMFTGELSPQLEQFSESDSGRSFTIKHRKTGRRILIEPRVTGPRISSRIIIDNQRPTSNDSQKTTIEQLEINIQTIPGEWYRLLGGGNGDTLEPVKPTRRYNTAKRSSDLSDLWIKIDLLNYGTSD